MTIHIEPMSELNEIVSLLAESDLPVSDISPSHPPRFFGVRADATLAAVVGLDLFGSVGLLRSLAVSPAYRGRGMARELVVFVERFAASRGVETLFLLTTTAADFFVKLGYLTASRPNAPAVIQTTPQFSDLCPSSSVFLSKRVAGLTDHSAGLRETPRSPINL